MGGRAAARVSSIKRDEGESESARKSFRIRDSLLISLTKITALHLAVDLYEPSWNRNTRGWNFKFAASVINGPWRDSRRKLTCASCETVKNWNVRSMKVVSRDTVGRNKAGQRTGNRTGAGTGTGTGTGTARFERVNDVRQSCGNRAE